MGGCVNSKHICCSCSNHELVYSARLSLASIIAPRHLKVSSKVVRQQSKLMFGKRTTLLDEWNCKDAIHPSRFSVQLFTDITFAISAQAVISWKQWNFILSKHIRVMQSFRKPIELHRVLSHTRSNITITAVEEDILRTI